MTKLTIGEKLQHVTCLIRTNTGTGTGFIYNIAQNEKVSIPMLATNRHVIEGATEISFRMTVCKDDGDPDFGNEVEFTMSIDHWKMHPDSQVDLAMAAIGGLLQQATDVGKRPFYIPLAADLIADESYLKNMDAIENILMIGYPTGIFDQANNLPVTRRGITASRIGLRYNGRAEFLIDCACFPGSSGSPIFQFDTGPELTRSGSMNMGGVRFKFLGILWGGPIYNVNGEIVAVPIETAIKAVPVTSIMTNLGFCIRATELAGFEAVFKREIESL